MARTGERIYVVRSGTSATNTTAVAMAAATAKTVVGVFGTAGTSICMVRFSISFDGVTTTAVPAVVEIGITSAAGTAGTAFTPVQTVGHSLASVSAGGYNFSGEPTYQRVLHSMYVPVLMGQLIEWTPLGEETQCDASQGLGIRVTSPSVVNCLASITFSE